MVNTERQGNDEEHFQCACGNGVAFYLSENNPLLEQKGYAACQQGGNGSAVDAPQRDEKPVAQNAQSGEDEDKIECPVEIAGETDQGRAEMQDGGDDFGHSDEEYDPLSCPVNFSVGEIYGGNYYTAR